MNPLIILSLVLCFIYLFIDDMSHKESAGAGCAIGALVLLLAPLIIVLLKS